MSYQVNETNLEKLILSFKKILNAIDQSDLREIGLRELLKLTPNDIKEGHAILDVLKDELKLFRAEG